MCNKTHDDNDDDDDANDDDGDEVIFRCLVLATVHLLSNFEMSILKYIGPFWRTDPHPDPQTDRQTDPHLSHPKTVPARRVVINLSSVLYTGWPS